VRSPARAIAWELIRRHRWGWVVLAGYALFGVSFRLFVLGPDHVGTLDPLDGLSATAIAPFPFLFLYLLAVFSFGFDGDLGGRRSVFPARMFTLPATTAALVGWPMLYGVLVVAGLVLGTALLIRWAWAIDIPLIWPPVYGATFLAWTQTLAWTPFGVRRLRILLAVLWLATINVVVFCAVAYRIPEPLLTALLAPQLPLAFLCARAAVARARCGDEPDPLEVLRRLRTRATALSGRWRSFSSPGSAQRWLEWRRHGLSLPVWVGVLLLFELVLLLTAGRGTPAPAVDTAGSIPPRASPPSAWSSSWRSWFATTSSSSSATNSPPCRQGWRCPTWTAGQP
jgi:hypothetical protein